jgi:hypothetical protein
MRVAAVVDVMPAPDLVVEHLLQPIKVVAATAERQVLQVLTELLIPEGVVAVAQEHPEEVLQAAPA